MQHSGHKTKRWWQPANVWNRTFTPVPKRIQDGTEDVLPAAILSGAPMELQARTVRLVAFFKNSTKSVKQALI